jgi:EAL domain-containing protein (putative c-di-GMP-specific phosphodiesterase class I)
VSTRFPSSGLGRLPIDVLKIDSSLVERIHEEPQRQEVMRAIGHIAERLSLDAIVEGVEHDAQRRILLSLGFRRAQGFLFSRPRPARRGATAAKAGHPSGRPPVTPTTSPVM